MRKPLNVISSGGILLCTVMSLLMVSLLSTTSEAKQADETKKYGMFKIPVHSLVVLQVETPAETPVETPVETPTATPVPPTNTPVPPTNTPTNTPVPPTNTPAETQVETPVETPTATPVPPTNTPVPPTNTPVPTNTPTPVDETPIAIPNLVLSAPGSVNVGEEFSVQVNITDAADIDAFGFDITPSGGGLSFVSADQAGTLTADFFFLQATLLGDGSVRVGAAGGNSVINGDGNLLNLRYAAATAGDITLDITNLLDDLSGATVSSVSLQVVGETGPDTPTATPIPPTATPVPPTPTPDETGPDTPTATPIPPTATPEPPTNTPVPPTPTPDETGPDTPTATPVPGDATPTPVPPTATPFVFENEFQGITLLDGFGGVHEIGDIVGFRDADGDGVLNDPITSLTAFPFFDGQDVYKDVEVLIDGSGAGASIRALAALRGNGRVFSQTISDNQITGVNTLPSLPRPFSSNDAVRGIDLIADEGGTISYAMVFNDGKVVLGTEGESSVTTIQDPTVDPNGSPAVDIEVIGSADGSISGYVLDALGRIHSMGGAPDLVGVPVSVNPVFVDMELLTVGDQTVAVVADGLGNFYVATEEGAAVPDVPLPVLGFNDANVLIDLEVQVDPTIEQFGGIGIMAVTRIASVHTAGAVDFFLTADGQARREGLEVSTTADGQTAVTLGFFGFDIVRDLEIYVIGQ